MHFRNAMDNSYIIYISLVALILSAFSLGWNIYRDVILKPRLRVRTQISSIVQPTKKLGTFIDISATNLGPGPIICNGVIIAKKSIFRFLGKRISSILGKQTRYAYVVHDYTNPLSGQVPKSLEVGERLTLLFSYVEDVLLHVDPTHVGIRDSFGRVHWSTRKSLKEAKKDYFGKFPKRDWGYRQPNKSS